MKILKLVGSDKYIERVYTYEDGFDGLELTRDIEEAIDSTGFLTETLSYIAKEVKEQHDCKVQVMEIL